MANKTGRAHLAFHKRIRQFDRPPPCASSRRRYGHALKQPARHWAWFRPLAPPSARVRPPADPKRHDWDNGRLARCGTPLGQRASRPLRHTTGTTGVSPVDTLGQRASRPLRHTTGTTGVPPVEMEDPHLLPQRARCPLSQLAHVVFSLRRLHILPETPRTSPFQRPFPARHSARFRQPAPPSAGDRRKPKPSKRCSCEIGTKEPASTRQDGQPPRLPWPRQTEQAPQDRQERTVPRRRSR